MEIHELMQLVNRSLFATLGYPAPDGSVQLRRVFCVWHKGLGGHLISTNTSSAHVQHLLQNGTASLYFSDDDAFCGLCLSGRAAVHRTGAFKRLLWNDGDEKYYPLGVDDPDYCVIEFTAERGSFYRYDGKGTLSAEDLAAFDAGKDYRNGYAAENG
ncbi:MAG: pyridoxamine 5'-phosphate oxidase family protein [Oscillospiraceae bacterium]|nr:pyridoxamine 5'-phosphate oxidase family protein [Oscillospiraceae bacterium]